MEWYGFHMEACAVVQGLVGHIQSMDAKRCSNLTVDPWQWLDGWFVNGKCVRAGDTCVESPRFIAQFTNMGL